MGHRLLGELPRSQNWLKLIDMLGVTDDPAAIAKQTSKAANHGIELAKRDQGIANIVFMLMNTVWSAQKEDFHQALSNMGISISSEASLLDLVGEFDQAVDIQLRRAGHRSDLAEMARFAAVDALTDMCRGETRNLFGISYQETQRVLKRYATADKFAVIG